MLESVKESTRILGIKAGRLLLRSS